MVKFGFPQGSARMLTKPKPESQAGNRPVPLGICLPSGTRDVLHPRSKVERLAVKNRMTIALGVICRGGLIIAADTRMSTSDGFCFDACKVKPFLTPSGVFTIAYASESGNAGETLVNEVTSDLTAKNPDSLNGVEQWLKAAMTRWYSEYREEPKTQLIVGTFIDHGTGLYFCQPPNTVTRKTLSDSSNGYVAIGLGASVTDPLFRTLFGPVLSPHICLREISYLMYRAKKENAFCGGNTDAVFLREEHAEPLLIKRLDMAQSESFGSRVDYALARTASEVIASTGDDSIILKLASDIYMKGLGYQQLEFHSTTGVKI